MGPIVNSDCEQFDFMNIDFTPMDVHTLSM